MTDISYLHRFCASKWGWCWGLTLQAPNTSNTIQYASNIPDMAEIQSICTVFGHKLHGRGPAEKSAPACLVHGKTRPSLKHEAGMRMVQDESGWKSHHLLWHFSDWNITRSRLGLLGLDRLGSNTMRDQASGPQGRQAFFKAKIWEKMWQFHAHIWEYLARNLRIWMDLRWFKMISAL